MEPVSKACENILDQSLLDQAYDEFVQEILEREDFIILTKTKITPRSTVSHQYLVSHVLIDKLETLSKNWSPEMDHDSRSTAIESALRAVKLQIIADGSLSIEGKDSDIEVTILESANQDGIQGETRTLSVRCEGYEKSLTESYSNLYLHKPSEILLNQQMVDDLVQSVLKNEEKTNSNRAEMPDPSAEKVNKKRKIKVSKQEHIQFLESEIEYLETKIGNLQDLLEQKEKQLREIFEKIQH